MLPLVQSATWRSEVVIAKVILTARAQKLRANEAEEGPGATSKLQEGHNWAPGGQIWKPVYGVRTIISLGPADGDLLTEPTFSQGGVYTPTIKQNVIKIIINYYKVKIRLPIPRRWNGEGGWVSDLLLINYEKFVNNLSLRINLTLTNEYLQEWR